MPQSSSPKNSPYILSQEDSRLPNSSVGGLTPRLIHVDPFNSMTVVAGTWQILAGPSNLGFEAAFNAAMSNSTQALNDQIDVVAPLLLSAGNWNIALLHYKGSNFGIITVLIDGSSVGTIDCFFATPGYQSDSVTGISIPTTGYHTLGFKIAGKHASSTNYACALFSIVLSKP